MMTPLHLRLVPACSSSDETNATNATSTSDSASASTVGQAATTEALPDTTEAATSTEVTTAATEPPTATTPDLLGSYTLADDEFGTMVTVTVAGGTRTIVTNALPDHETGQFPNQGNPNTITAQDLTWTFPTEPVFTGSATFARTSGVAVNGVKFEPATAETVTCASGEGYSVEALQDTYDLGLDFNNAHVQPTGEYHYHGISQLLAAAYESDDDLVLVGFAADGYLMYYSKSGAYESGYELSTTPRTGSGCVGSSAIGSADVDVEGTMPDGTYSSDWVFSDGAGDLDSCNGTTIDGEYVYLVTDTFPFVSRCLNGETSEASGAAAGEGGAPPAGGEAPDLSEAAAALGISVDELTAVLPARP
jgi:YHYH protein